MGITLELPEDLAHELEAEATQLGLSLNDYLVRILAGGRAPAQMPKTGAELVTYWQGEGLIGSRPGIADSQQHARDLRAEAERRPRG